MLDIRKTLGRVVEPLIDTVKTDINRVKALMNTLEFKTPKLDKVWLRSSFGGT